MTKKELAISYHDKKYNCAQAVACAFSEEINMEPEALFRITEGFGLGMGGAQSTCGALTGAIILAGLKNSDGNLSSPKTKADTYRISKDLQKRFEEKAGATICKDLKGMESGAPLRSCSDCIRDGVEVVQEVLGL